MTRSGRDPFRDPFRVPLYRGGNAGNGSGGSRNEENDGNGSQRLSMDSWHDRLTDAVEKTTRTRARRTAVRREFQAARDAGLRQRHQHKLTRETTMKTAIAEPSRIIRCRYTKRTGDICSAEAVDPLGEIVLCTRHLAAALELIRRRMGMTW